MTINDLWKVVADAGHEEELGKYSLRRAIFNGGGSIPVKPVILGIDASIWLNECQAVFCTGHHAQTGLNAELRTLFYRLARMLQMPIVPLFVFDGQYRPKRKREKNVIPLDHFLVDFFKEFINAFGFQYHTAPGEAEAELAYLNKRGTIDAVLTRDGDALIFGATHVWKSLPSAHGTDKIDVYDASVIETFPSVLLTEGGLLLFALLTGGDYDLSRGIKGCGGIIARGLAQTKQGDKLRRVARAGRQPIADFRPELQAILCKELRTNIHSYLPRRCPALADIIERQNFPAINAVRSYTHPIVNAMIHREDLISKNIDLREIARLCELRFGWKVFDIAKSFINVLFGGIAYRQLLDDLRPMTSYRSKHFITPRCLPRPLGRAADVECYSIKVSIGHLTESLPSFLRGLREPSAADKDPNSLPTFISFKAPAVLAHAYLPHLFKKTKKQYHKKQSVAKAHQHTESRAGPSTK